MISIQEKDAIRLTIYKFVQEYGECDFLEENSSVMTLEEKLDKKSLYDDFGLDSLGVLNLLNHVEAASFIDVSEIDFKNDMTVGELIEELENKRKLG